MAVRAITPVYPGEPRDTADKFHGNILVFVDWVDHRLFCGPLALPLPPDMPFGNLIKDVLPGTYSLHPEWEKVDAAAAQWLLNEKPFSPDPDASLTANGIDHKSLLRLITPGLTGINGSSN